MDSWLNSLRQSRHGEELPDDIFFPSYRQLIRRLFADPTTVVMVMARTDSGEIVGYSVSTPAKELLHWIYLKEKYRRLGLSRALLQHLPRPYRHSLQTISSRQLNLGSRDSRFLRSLRVAV